MGFRASYWRIITTVCASTNPVLVDLRDVRERRSERPERKRDVRTGERTGWRVDASLRFRT